MERPYQLPKLKKMEQVNDVAEETVKLLDDYQNILTNEKDEKRNT